MIEWNTIESHLGSANLGICITQSLYHFTGTEIVLEFTKDTDIKMLFWFAHANRETLIQNQRFQSHSRQFCHTLNAIVESLDRPERLMKILAQLAKQHIAVAGFEDQYFQQVLVDR